MAHDSKIARGLSFKSRVPAAALTAALLGIVWFRLLDRRTPRQATTVHRLDPPVDPARDHVRGPVDAPLDQQVPPQSVAVQPGQGLGLDPHGSPGQQDDLQAGVEEFEHPDQLADDGVVTARFGGQLSSARQRLLPITKTLTGASVERAGASAFRAGGRFQKSS